MVRTLSVAAVTPLGSAHPSLGAVDPSISPQSRPSGYHHHHHLHSLWTGNCCRNRKPGENPSSATIFFLFQWTSAAHQERLDCSPPTCITLHCRVLLYQGLAKETPRPAPLCRNNALGSDTYWLQQKNSLDNGFSLHRSDDLQTDKDTDTEDKSSEPTRT